MHELSFTLSTEELTEWVAWFELQKDPVTPKATPDQQYAVFRNILN